MLQALLNTYDQEIFFEWAQMVPYICQENLVKPVFIIHEDRSLASNFNPELAAILRETRYMNVLQRNNLPQEAVDLFARTEFFFNNNYTINLIVIW